MASMGIVLACLQKTCYLFQFLQTAGCFVLLYTCRNVLDPTNLPILHKELCILQRKEETEAHGQEIGGIREDNMKNLLSCAHIKTDVGIQTDTHQYLPTWFLKYSQLNWSRHMPWSWSNQRFESPPQKSIYNFNYLKLMFQSIDFFLFRSLKFSTHEIFILIVRKTILGGAKEEVFPSFGMFF